VVAAAVTAILYAEWILLSTFGSGRPLVGLPSGREELTKKPSPMLETTTMLSRNQTGTWIGNNWVPPRDWHLFSAKEMLELYQDKSVLWVGDSTTRRAALTLYGILQAPSDAIPTSQIDGAYIIDVNKRTVTEPCHRYGNHTEVFPVTHCRIMPTTSNGRNNNNNNSTLSSGTNNNTNEKLFSLYWSNCMADLESFLLRELAVSENQTNSGGLTGEYDVLIIGQGIWEAVRGSDCRRLTGGRTLEHMLNTTLDLLEQLAEQRPELTIVWRTCGFHQDGMNNAIVHSMNEQAMDRIDQYAPRPLGERGRPYSSSNLVYVNFGQAIQARSYGKDRIAGDLKPHYGLEARYALLQMISNVLQLTLTTTDHSSKHDSVGGRNW
jgi:hypothetical protein